MKNKTLWIAETAVMIALLVALQWATKPLGQFVTGSCVNLVLGVSTLVGGAWCGAVVAIASPFCAFLVGVGPAKLVIVPFIAVGNLVLVLLLHFIAGGKPLGLRSYLAVAAAAVCKFAVLFLLVTKVAIPSLQLPEAAAALRTAICQTLPLSVPPARWECSPEPTDKSPPYTGRPPSVPAPGPTVRSCSSFIILS